MCVICESGWVLAYFQCVIVCVLPVDSGFMRIIVLSYTVRCDYAIGHLLHELIPIPLAPPSPPRIALLFCVCLRVTCVFNLTKYQSAAHNHYLETQYPSSLSTTHNFIFSSQQYNCVTCVMCICECVCVCLIQNIKCNSCVCVCVRVLYQYVFCLHWLW